MRQRVFVAMPFGRKEVRSAPPAIAGEAHQAAIYANFDEVFDRLIKPALEAANCEPELPGPTRR